MSEQPTVTVELSRAEAEWLIEECNRELADIDDTDCAEIKRRVRAALQAPQVEQQPGCGGSGDDDLGREAHAAGNKPGSGVIADPNQRPEPGQLAASGLSAEEGSRGVGADQRRALEIARTCVDLVRHDLPPHIGEADHAAAFLALSQLIEQPSNQPQPVQITEEDRDKLLDEDGPVLLSLREEVSMLLPSEGLSDEEGDDLHANDPVTERIGDKLSAHVADSLDTALRNIAHRYTVDRVADPDRLLEKIPRYVATGEVEGGDAVMAPAERGKWVLFDTLEALLRQHPPVTEEQKCDGCEQVRPVVSIGEEALCGECICERGRDFEQAVRKELSAVGAWLASHADGWISGKEAHAVAERIEGALAEPVTEEHREKVSFTCCNWDKLSPESKRAVEEVVQATADRFAESPLSAEELREYEDARRSVVEARDADSDGRSVIASSQPQPVTEEQVGEGDGERLKLKVVVSGAPFKVCIGRQQPVSDLITAALFGAGIKRREDVGTWALRTKDASLLRTLDGVEDGATLFLDPEAGGGASLQRPEEGDHRG